MIGAQDKDVLSYLVDLEVRPGRLWLGAVPSGVGFGQERVRQRCSPSQPGKEVRTAREDTCPLLSHCSWQVEVVGHPKYRCRVMCFFVESPYFRNPVIMKEYQLSFASRVWVP